MSVTTLLQESLAMRLGLKAWASTKMEFELGTFWFKVQHAISLFLSKSVLETIEYRLAGVLSRSCKFFSAT